MGRIVVRKKTEITQAYEIPGLKIQVYTPEELAYVYYQNLPRLETEIMEEKLISWLEGCGKGKLARRLAETIKKGREGLAEFVVQLLSGIPFYSEKEIREAGKALLDWNQADPNLRKKEKLDYLFEVGRVREAMRGYEELLQEEKSLSKEFLAKIYHNQGTAYARLFLFSEAAASLKRAWELSGSQDSKELYMLALRMSLPKESYVNRIGEEHLGEEKAVELEEKLLKLLRQEESSENRRRLTEARRQRELGKGAYCEEMLHMLTEDLKQAWRNRYGDF